jgi:hypothetical protein
VSVQEDRLRRTLADQAYDLRPPPDPLAGVRRSAERQRRSARVRGMAALLAAVVLLGGVALVNLVRTQILDRPGPVASGLLPWPSQGNLRNDRSLIRAANGVFTQAAPGIAAPPFHARHVLYAGTVGEGRLVVLEALDQTGAAWIGVIGEHGPTGRTKLTMEDRPDRLFPPFPPVLVVPYDGNIDLPGLEPAAPGAYVQALAEPGITAVLHRGRGTEGLDLSSPTAPGFRRSPVIGGLSSAWFTLPNGPTRGVVRALSGDRVVYEGLVDLDEVDPRPVSVHLAGAPPGWLAGSAVAAQQVHDDALLYAAQREQSDVVAAPLWSGSLPDGIPARMVWLGEEAIAVTGWGDRSRLCSIMEVTPPPTLLGADCQVGSEDALVVVGDSAVTELTVRYGSGRVVRVSGRSYVAALPGVPQDDLTVAATLLDGQTATAIVARWE